MANFDWIEKMQTTHQQSLMLVLRSAQILSFPAPLLKLEMGKLNETIYQMIHCI